MVSRKIIIGATCTTLFLLNACKPKLEDQAFSAGDIDATRFVMIGGGHVAGYMDDALYAYGQENSLANLIAMQLQEVALGNFYQPLVSSGSIGISSTGLARMELGYKTDCKGVTSLSPVRVAASGDASIWNDMLYTSTSPFGNFGIPGMKLSEVNTPSYGDVNGFFKRMASNATTSVMDDAMAVDPTFFSLFLGMEDVLAYAKSGGKGTVLPTPAEFENAYRPIVEQLVGNGAKGVLATLPDVTKMPYFTTIPYNGLTLDASNNSTLNSIYNPIGYYFELGSNPFMVVDSSANDFAVRQMYSGELLLLSLPLDSVKCNQMGVLFPIRDEFYLDLNEISYIRVMINAYNEIIRTIADDYSLAITDVHEYAQTLADGFTYNGVSMSAKFVSGGAYSLDGIHMNPRGNALLANQFIQSINAKYNARIPQLNAMDFNATLFP
ncbi:MAG: SGNH/GDSL hydrolase family protein [Flavobacteriia bacterium]|jgi:hypothetical protein